MAERASVGEFTVKWSGKRDINRGRRVVCLDSPQILSSLGVEAREALARVLGSESLANRPRLREFLEYVTREALEGRAEEVKEQSIGVAVFGRPQGYNASDDTIVRVTARQLRQKLDEYYAGEGKGDGWRLSIPRGGYVPVLEAAGSAPVVAPEVVILERKKSWGWVWVVALLVAAVGAYWWWPQPTIFSLLTMRENQRIDIVTGDAAVQIYKILTGWGPALDDYRTKKYLEAEGLPKEDKVWKALGNANYPAPSTGPLLMRIAQSLPKANLAARHPKEMVVRDFSDDSAILLGGPFANPWVQLFENHLNFRVRQDGPGDAFVENLKPRAGEAAVYRTHAEGEEWVTYARLAYLPNLSGRGRVLLFGGPSSVLLEKFAELAADASFLRDLKRDLGVGMWEELPWCEVLMEAKEVATAPAKMRVLALRRVEIAK